MPDPVIEGIAKDCGKDEGGEQNPYVENTRPGKCSGNEEQSVTGEIGGHDKTGFAEQDDEQDNVRQEAVFLDNEREIGFEMEDNIQGGERQGHRAGLESEQNKTIAVFAFSGGNGKLHWECMTGSLLWRTGVSRQTIPHAWIWIPQRSTR